MALCVVFILMPIGSATETPNLENTLDKDKLVNTVSNNASAGNTTTLSEEEIQKLQKWLQDKNITNNNGLVLGATGDQVKKLQQWLTENNFYNGQIDGNFGNDTEAAVKAFQKQVGLNEDGQVGNYTLLAMQQWDEYADAVTNSDSSSSSSSSDKVYSSVSTSSKKTTTNSKKVTTSKTSKKTYSTKTYSTRYSGYTNGMDCWAMSAYISSQLRNQGYTVRTIQYATSLSSRHRTVQYYNGNSWVNYDYKGNGYSKIYYTTSNSKNGVVVG